MDGARTRYVAMLDGAMRARPLSFEGWWSEIVFVDDRRAVLTRKDLVLSVADQDGGAHVDANLNETYGRLSREHSLGWVAMYGQVERPILQPERAAVRQIAHEVLRVLVPGYKKTTVERASAFVGASGAHRSAPRKSFAAGRNEPCPCGSGKKFKKCHGAPTA